MGPKNSTRKRRRVAIAYPLAVPHMTIFYRGFLDYAQQNGDWLVTTSPPSLIGAGEVPLTLHHLRGWSGDGVLAAILNKADIRMARELGMPVVNAASTLRETGVPRVRPDHRAMGRLAAEHLLERGLRRLAYYGLKGFWFSELRCRGFVECAQQAGATCDVLQVPRVSGPWTSLQKRVDLLSEWLKQLRPPVGLLAVQDYRARAVIEECDRLGLHIPHDVAIVGMEDDPTLCEFSAPTLSSVARDAWLLGYESAKTLDRLMNGLATSMDQTIPPRGVVARQSSDTIAVEDPDLTDALHFIHDHLNEPFGIDQIVQATSVSRRQLEVHFCRVLGCTPLDYVNRRRIARAQQLLAASGRVKLHKLAMACGFSSAQRMRLVFKRVTGMTPIEYRRKEKGRTSSMPSVDDGSQSMKRPTAGTGVVCCASEFGDGGTFTGNLPRNAEERLIVDRSNELPWKQ